MGEVVDDWMFEMKQRQTVLLVEDDDNDAVLVQRTFARVGASTGCYRVARGESAIRYLKGEGLYANREEYPLPALVLLDLKLPGMSGFAVLEWIRTQQEFRSLPVVVLTASDAIRDANAAYRLGANSFLVKPLDFENAQGLVAALKGYRILDTEQREA